MTTRTRYFMFGSALILLVGLCTGLVAMYNGGLPLLKSAPGPGDLVYLPADTSAVGYANVHEIMGSQFRQKLRQVLPTGEEKDKLLQETGIDVEHDIDTVVAGFTATEPAGSGAIVLVRGRFDQGRIETLARQHGATVEDYKGKRLILAGDHVKTHDPSTPGSTSGPMLSATGSVAFLESGLVALGESAAIKRAIDARQSRENVTSNADLMKYVSEVDKSSNAWVVGHVDAGSRASAHGLPQQVTDQLAAVQWFAVTTHVDGGVTGVIRVEARDAEAGDQLRSVVNGGLAAAHLMAGRDAKIDTLINSLQLTGTGKTAMLSFTVPPEVLDLINGLAGLKKLTSGPGAIKK